MFFVQVCLCPVNLAMWIVSSSWGKLGTTTVWAPLRWSQGQGLTNTADYQLLLLLLSKRVVMSLFLRILVRQAWKVVEKPRYCEKKTKAQNIMLSLCPILRIRYLLNNQPNLTTRSCSCQIFLNTLWLVQFSAPDDETWLQGNKEKVGYWKMGLKNTAVFDPR